MARLTGVVAEELLSRSSSCSKVEVPDALAHDELLTTGEAARVLRCSTSFLYRRTDLVPPMRLGGRRRYRRPDLLRFLETTRTPAVSLPVSTRYRVAGRPSSSTLTSGIRRKPGR